MKKMLRAYVVDLGVVLGWSHRDSRGRFVKGNRFRFQAVRVHVDGAAKWFLAQDAMAGNFFRAIGG